MFYTIKETREALKSGKITSKELVESAKKTYEADASAAIPLNAFIELYEDSVAKAEAADKEIADAKAAGTLNKLASNPYSRYSPARFSYHGQRTIPHSA